MNHSHVPCYSGIAPVTSMYGYVDKQLSHNSDNSGYSSHPSIMLQSGATNSDYYRCLNNNHPSKSFSVKKVTGKKGYVNQQNGQFINAKMINVQKYHQYIAKIGYPADTRYKVLKDLPIEFFFEHYLGTSVNIASAEFDKYLPKQACISMFPRADLFLNLTIVCDPRNDELGTLKFNLQKLAEVTKVHSWLLVGYQGPSKSAPKSIESPPSSQILTSPFSGSFVKQETSQFEAPFKKLSCIQLHGLQLRQNFRLVQVKNQQYTSNNEQSKPFVLQRTQSCNVLQVPAIHAVDEVANHSWVPNHHPSVQPSQSYAISQSRMKPTGAFAYNGSMPIQLNSAKVYADPASTASTVQYTQLPSSRQLQSTYWSCPSTASSSSSAAFGNCQPLKPTPLLPSLKVQTKSSRIIPSSMIVFDQNRPAYRQLPRKPLPLALSNPPNANSRSNLGGNVARNPSPAKGAQAPALRRKERTVVSTAKAIVSYYPIDNNPNPIKRRRIGSLFSELNPSTVDVLR